MLQAGVRKSIKYPATYLNNIIAMTNLFEVIKDYKLCPVILANSAVFMEIKKIIFFQQILRPIVQYKCMLLQKNQQS